MRVIGGTYRSRRLSAPRGLATRPTSDRLRETLFNVLAARIEGAVFADLYAGSGAVGVEALSRGASFVHFVDEAAPAVEAIRSNLTALDVRTGFKVHVAKVSVALRHMSKSATGCDILFLDPPYLAIDDYAQTLTAIASSADSLLKPEGIVVAEHSRLGPGDIYGPLHRWRVLQQGDASLSFYRLQTDQDKT